MNADVDTPLLHVAPGGPFAVGLNGLAHLTLARYAVYWLLPVFALLWAVFPLVSTRRHSLERMGPIALLALYGVVIVAAGGFDEYGRYHTVYLSATSVLVLGTLLFNLEIANRATPALGVLTAGLLIVEISLVVLLLKVPIVVQATPLVLAAVLLGQSSLLWFIFSRQKHTLAWETKIAPVSR